MSKKHNNFYKKHSLSFFIQQAASLGGIFSLWRSLKLRNFRSLNCLEVRYELRFHFQLLFSLYYGDTLRNMRNIVRKRFN